MVSAELCSCRRQVYSQGRTAFADHLLLLHRYSYSTGYGPSANTWL